MGEYFRKLKIFPDTLFPRKGELDLDAQGSLSIAMGCDYPNRCPVTMAEIFQIMKDTQGSADAVRGILSVSENLAYIPAGRKMALAEQELCMTKAGPMKQFMERIGSDGCILPCGFR